MTRFNRIAGHGFMPSILSKWLYFSHNRKNTMNNGDIFNVKGLFICRACISQKELRILMIAPKVIWGNGLHWQKIRFREKLFSWDKQSIIIQHGSIRWMISTTQCKYYRILDFLIKTMTQIDFLLEF